jgi:hypothetical protein
MKTFVLSLLSLIGLAGCVVVPAGHPAYHHGPRVYSAPPPVVVVPARPHPHRGYWGPRYRYYGY